MSFCCSSAAEKNPTTTRKSINTCYSQIRRYLGSKVPAGKVKTKPPVSLSASTASSLPARGGGGGGGVFYFFIYSVLFHLGLSRRGPFAAANRQPGPRLPGARRRPRLRLPQRSRGEVAPCCSPATEGEAGCEAWSGARPGTGTCSGWSAGTRPSESGFECGTGQLGDALV